MVSCKCFNSCMRAGSEGISPLISHRPTRKTRPRAARVTLGSRFWFKTLAALLIQGVIARILEITFVVGQFSCFHSDLASFKGRVPCEFAATTQVGRRIDCNFAERELPRVLQLILSVVPTPQSKRLERHRPTRLTGIRDRLFRRPLRPTRWKKLRCRSSCRRLVESQCMIRMDLPFGRRMELWNGYNVSSG